MYNNVRWLSPGKVLQRFVECLEEIRLFLATEKILHNYKDFQMPNGFPKLMFFTDLCLHANNLKFCLQGRNETIITMCDLIKTFEAKGLFIEMLLRKRRDRWSEAVRSIDFSHSSRKAWTILNNLTGRSRHSPRHCPVSADAIAFQLVRNGRYEAVDCKSSRLVSQEVSNLWRATTPDAVTISDNFSQREFAAALLHVKPGKAPGPHSIFSELILHAGAALKSWLRDFLSSCLRRLKIPKIWRRALVVAIPKPAKPVGNPKSYRPISLLCVPYKILERLIYARVEPLIDPLLPKEQARFRCRKSTVDQVVLLTQNIEDSFEAKKKAGAVFIDLTAAYDTV